MHGGVFALDLCWEETTDWLEEGDGVGWGGRRLKVTSPLSPILAGGRSLAVPLAFSCLLSTHGQGGWR